MAKNYYDILGVSKSSTQEEIKKAYYKLAHKHHPHKGGDEQKMKEINEAYGVLGNAEKRSQYDKFGSTFQQGSGAGGFGGFQDFSDFAQAFRGSAGNNAGANFSFDFGDLGDIFGDFFGGGRGQGRSQSRNRGSDIEAQITIEFTEAVFGTEKNISLTKDATCQACTGTGAQAGSKVLTCSTCHGTGQVVRNVGFGIGMPSVCPDCRGEGKKVEQECQVCRGAGVVKKSENIKVKIPAGIDDGQAIRLAGYGAAGRRGAQAGDLYLKVKVTPNKSLQRDGYDIKTVAEISFKQAALGDKIDVITVDGVVKLKIPEGTQSGKVFIIKGRGVPHLQGRNRGDHLVEVIVKTPTKLSRQQRKQIEALDLD
ncbi:MAG: molecular chaperone DnaJ [Candidatus Buchananbacteria bacterium]|nr:molecular chaperone DnaJ [Candidatus Buchananbacteria bacterium]